MADFAIAKQRAPVEVVSDGYCVLIVGPEKARIHANPLFLSAASEPFRAMFEPEWREGDDLRSRADPAEIRLPEDNATALRLVCAVIHHENDTIPHELPIHTLLDIAVTADKYDCISALKFASESWLCPDRDKASELLVLTAAAYLYRNATAFRKITKKLILIHNGPFAAISCAEVEAVMDWRVFGEYRIRYFGRSSKHR